MTTAATAARHEVTIPGFVPTRLNDLLRMHWAKRHERLMAEEVVIGHSLRMAGVPRATGKRRVTQRITLQGRDRPRDDDNAWKGLLDALVNGGFLVDDSAAWVEREPLEFDRGQVRATTIILEDLP